VHRIPAVLAYTSRGARSSSARDARLKPHAFLSPHPCINSYIKTETELPKAKPISLLHDAILASLIRDEVLWYALVSMKEHELTESAKATAELSH